MAGVQANRGAGDIRNRRCFAAGKDDEAGEFPDRLKVLPFIPIPIRIGTEDEEETMRGMAFSKLIDNAGWFTVAPHYENWIVTVEFSTRLHEPVANEDLWSIGRVVRMGNRMASAEMEVRTVNNQLVATGAGTFIVTSTPYEAGS